MASLTPQEVDIDILVAGGGPAGLAAACAIHRATGYSVKVCFTATAHALPNLRHPSKHLLSKHIPSPCLGSVRA